MSIARYARPCINRLWEPLKPKDESLVWKVHISVREEQQPLAVQPQIQANFAQETC